MIFFHLAISMTDKTPSFTQSLDKMKSHLLVENLQKSIDFMGDLPLFTR